MNETVVESSAKAVVELNEKIRVLHVDDDSGILKITKQVLESEAPVEVDTALSVEEALSKLEKEKFDIVVSDYQMPGKDGLDLLKTLRSNENTIPFIMFTGKGREEVAIKALNLGANQYLNKVGETETVYTELAHSITELAKTRKAEEKQCESEEKFRSLFEKANDGLVFVDVAGRIVDVNQKAAELAEKRKEDLVGKSFLDLGLVSPRDLPALAEKLKQQAMGKPTERFEVEIQRGNGEKRLIEINSTFIQKNNMTTGSLAIVRDITERKQAEEALKVSEEKYRNLFENSKDLKVMYDLKGNLTAVNKVAVEYGFVSDEHIGKNMLEFVSKTEVPRLHKEVEEILQGKSVESEIEIDTPKGKRTLEYIASPIREKGEITGICGSYKDVTDRKKAEEALRESEELYSRLSAAAFDGIGIFKQGKIIDANYQLAKMLGYELGELIGLAVLDFVAPESRDLVTENMQKGYEGPYEHLAMRKDGSVFPVEIRARSIPYKGQPAIVTAIRDITEGKKLEKSLGENEEKFAGLFSGNPEATVFTDPSMNILEVNPRFVSLFGYKLDEVKGKRLVDVVVPKNLLEEGRMLDWKAAEGYVYHDTVRMRKDGSLIPVLVSAAPISVQGRLIGYIGVYKDISELKTAEGAMTEMMQKVVLTNEKLRVVGGLTRHDVRNKLSVISATTYLLRKQLASDSGILERIKDMETAVQQVTQIFEFAKAYESLGVEELVYSDVDKTVDEAVALYPDLKDTKMTNNCSGLAVLADSLLRQMFYNLIDNSLKHGQKTSRIEIRYEEASRDELRLYYEDDGVGISEAVKLSLFKEGFTTGKGTGYGLYLIKKIMEVYGWTIQETGTPGKGAQFTITIPRTNENAKENYRIAAHD